MTAATTTVGAGHVWLEDFRHRAACRDVDPELFYPTAEFGLEYDAQVGAAKAVCARCPVRVECLVWALDSLPYGVAGGLTEQERREARVTSEAENGGEERGGNRAPLRIFHAKPRQGHERKDTDDR